MTSHPPLQSLCSKLADLDKSWAQKFPDMFEKISFNFEGDLFELQWNWAETKQLLLQKYFVNEDEADLYPVVALSSKGYTERYISNGLLRCLAKHVEELHDNLVEQSKNITQIPPDLLQTLEKLSK